MKKYLVSSWSVTQDTALKKIELYFASMKLLNVSELGSHISNTIESRKCQSLELELQGWVLSIINKKIKAGLIGILRGP